MKSRNLETLQPGQMNEFIGMKQSKLTQRGFELPFRMNFSRGDHVMGTYQGRRQRKAREGSGGGVRPS